MTKRAIPQIVVTAQQMRDIEGRIFAAGMPVAALMEKVAGMIYSRILQLYPIATTKHVGILVGPGHNGGDAAVVARELHFRGYDVGIYCPFSKVKELTSQHLQYTQSLGIPSSTSVSSLEDAELIIDGLFGFGLERELVGDVAAAINQVNLWQKPVISIDLPSGLHTDTGEVLGTAIRATHTLCLGLWKLGLFQDSALEYVGKAELIDFDIPETDVNAVLADVPKIKLVTDITVSSTVPLPRPSVTHKYQQGHLLLICGSRRYAGGAILTGLGARGSGVGMLSIAVPESLQDLLVAQLPEALIIGCPETETGAIAQLKLPENISLTSFDAIACGPGLTRDAGSIVRQVLESTTALLLDADALNILASLGTNQELRKRQAYTVITPHAGEFQRLFPDIPTQDRITAVVAASKQSQATVLFKGARTAIANPLGNVWIVPESTPALARGGSGDVLTGLMGGLLAQNILRQKNLDETVATAAWWHAKAGIMAASDRTELGVDAHTLTQYLLKVLSSIGHL
ncbi:YjeF-related protein [Calothrix sp. PCC 6303]|nr:YjeF-related protein [Calothrix sp. PCC 6303]